MAIYTLAVEGDADVSVVRRILEHVGTEAGVVHGLRGKYLIDASIGGYNHAARHSHWLVVRDLNGDAPCASALRAALLPAPAPGMCFRIAVRAMEAWLLADAERIAQFLGISAGLVSRDPDNLANPKRELINLARRARSRAIREDLVPPPHSTAQVGPGYTGRISAFAAEAWRPATAARSSSSLARCIADLRMRLNAGAASRDQQGPTTRGRGKARL
jgi:hypothetical protein